MQVIHRQDRSITRVFGRDPVKMVQGLATNDIANVADGEAVYTTFLTPKGKLIGAARVWKQNGEVWIEADRAASENIRAHLKKSVPPLFAKFEPVEALHVVGTIGSSNVEAVAKLVNLFQDDVVDVVVDDAGLADLMTHEKMTPEADERRRIEAGEPRWGFELTEDVIPLEAELRSQAISETKGCYTGQEVIIRILHRGHVNRHLRSLSSPQQIAAGQELRNADGKVVGRVTSVVYDDVTQTWKGLGYVRREVDPPATLHAGGVDVQINKLQREVRR